MTTEYVCGFAFNQDKTKVLLINKNRPDWQAGKLNGIGGHIEQGEAKLVAMQREFREETGIVTKFHQWIPIIGICNHTTSWKVYFFWTVTDITKAIKTTDEEPIAIAVNDLWILRDKLVSSNLLWLIPMALDIDVKDMFVG